MPNDCVKNLMQACAVGLDRFEQLVVIGSDLHRQTCGNFRCNQDRRDWEAVACLMEVLEVECEVTDLIDRCRCKLGLVDLELQNEHYCLNDRNNVDSQSESRNGVLEVDMP